MKEIFIAGCRMFFEPTELDDVEEHGISMNTQFKIRIRSFLHVRGH